MSIIRHKVFCCIVGIARERCFREIPNLKNPKLIVLSRGRVRVLLSLSEIDNSRLAGVDLDLARQVETLCTEPDKECRMSMGFIVRMMNQAQLLSHIAGKGSGRFKTLCVALLLGEETLAAEIFVGLFTEALSCRNTAQI